MCIVRFEQLLRATPFTAIERKAKRGFLQGASFLDINLAGRRGEVQSCSWWRRGILVLAGAFAVHKLTRTLALIITCCCCFDCALLTQSDDPRFINEERLLAAKPCTLGHVRGYLFNMVGLSRLFDGNGYTLDNNGNRGPREYLVRGDVRVNTIPGFRYVKFPISLPAPAVEQQQSAAMK